MRYWILNLLLVISPLPAWATSALPDFHATYRVYALGMQLGESRQQFHCQQNTCTLKAKTFPTGMAKLFTDETLEETSTLIHQARQLQWQTYLKKKFSGGKLKKTVTLKRENDHVRYVEKNRQFPLRQHLYDLLSLPVALSFYLQQHPDALPDRLYAQDNNWQDALTIVERAQKDHYTFGDTRPGLSSDETLPVTEDSHNDDRAVRALRYTLDMPHARVRIWLMPDHAMLPAQVEIYRKDDRHTLTLKLAEPPHLS